MWYIHRLVMKFFIFTLVGLILYPADAQNMHRIVDLKGKWKFTIGDNPQWAGTSYDDSNWAFVRVPSAWEDQGFSGFDGYAWYRITIHLRNIDERNLFLVLGYIDDADEVYLNGELIGFSGSFPPNFYTAFQSHRQYYLPPDLLNKNGKNVIAVRVFDTILEGGIIKGDIGIYANRDEPAKTYSLEGIWKFREGDNQWWKDARYDDSTWDQIMAPSYWRSLKHKEIIEGTAWYRKQFILPDYLQDEPELVLVLGKIDDFDETYLNEQLIGKTYDGAIYGLSGSYDKYRVYPIPEHALNRKGKNMLSVKVRDIGGNAGIYKGPLAIVPLKDVKKLLLPK